jgi:outer membrane lipoprotein-sorting protein
MRMALLVAVFAVGLAAAPGALGGDGNGPSLATRAARFPPLRTATAEFDQEREVSLVDEVLRAKGRLALAAPAAFRLDLTAPEPLTLIAEDKTLTVQDALGKTLPLPPEFAGLATFARTLTDLLLGSRSPEGFDQSWRDADTVVLLPQTGTASPFSEITLRFAPTGQLPDEISMRERGGDRTTIRLHDVALNAPLEPGRFKAPVAGTAPVAKGL